MLIVKSLLFNFFLYFGIVFVFLLALPTLFLPAKSTLLFGKFLGHYVIFIVKFFLNTEVEIKGINYIAVRGNFLVRDDENKIITKLKPENRFYPITNIFTTEASIHSNLFRDLYIVLGEGSTTNGWVVRIYYNPLVIWIWIGSLLIFLGGIVSLNTNLKKLLK